VSCDGLMPWFWPGLGMSIVGAAGIALMAVEKRREKLETWLAAERGPVSTRLRSAWASLARMNRTRVVLGAACLVVLLGVGAVAHGGSRLSLPAIEGLGGSTSTQVRRPPPTHSSGARPNGGAGAITAVARARTSIPGWAAPATRRYRRERQAMARHPCVDSARRRQGKDPLFADPAAGKGSPHGCERVGKLSVSALVGSQPVFHRDYRGDSGEDIRCPTGSPTPRASTSTSWPPIRSRPPIPRRDRLALRSAVRRPSG